MSRRQRVRRWVEKTGFTVERIPHRLGPAHHLGRIFGAYDIDAVIDVGANEGQFGRMVRQAGFIGRIVSFEPQTSAFRRLASQAADDEDWLTRKLALGPEPATRELNLTAASVASSFLTPRSEWRRKWPGATLAGSESVQVCRLDDLDLPEGQLLLKVDTQGYDLEVLAGAVDLLSQPDRVIALQIELSVSPLYKNSPDYLEAMRRVHDLGFTLSGVFPAVLPDERVRAVELDGIFVRA